MLVEVVYGDCSVDFVRQIAVRFAPEKVLESAMTAAALKRNARVEARCTPEQSELIEKAADFLGRSKTDFIVSTLQEIAMKTIKDFETMELNAKDSSALADALLNPPAPSDSLRAAAESYIKATS